MKRKGLLKLDGGLSIMVPLAYATTSSAGWYEGSDTLNTADNEQVTSAEYNWKFAYANITIKRTDELKNSGDAQILSLVKEKTSLAEKTLADNLGTAMWNAGTDAKALGGLRHLLSTSNTVGGISQTSNTWWAAQVDSSTTTLTMSALQTQYNAASIGNDSPSVGFTTRAVYNLYYNLLQPQQRFQDTDTAKGGFSSLMFNGIPIVVDSHAPSGDIAFINEDYMKLVAHKDEFFRFEPFVKPVNQNVKVAKIYFAGNLVSSNNRMHAYLSALTA